MGFLANAVDQTGTFLGLPELGFSERLNGGQDTTNTQQYQQLYNPIQTVSNNIYQKPTTLNTQPSNTAASSARPSNTSILGATSTINPNNNNSNNNNNNGNANNDLVSQYKARGWNDMNSINADIANGGYNSWINSAKDSNAAELQGLNTNFDQLSAQLQDQLGYLGSEKANARNTLDTDFNGVQTTVNHQKEAAQTNNERQVSDAGNSAQQTQRQNRNVLRSLGILNSTAAGELLSKPLNQFDKIKADLGTQLTQRVGELDDFLNQKMSEHSNAITSLENNYSKVVGDIQRDLRFNDRQRGDAIKAANAALSQRLADIQMSAQNYAQQVAMMKEQYSQGLSKVNNYTMPTANLSGITQTGISGQDFNPANVGLALSDEQKRRQQGLLGSAGV